MVEAVDGAPVLGLYEAWSGLLLSLDRDSHALADAGPRGQPVVDCDEKSPRLVTCRAGLRQLPARESMATLPSLSDTMLLQRAV
jgi:hypothetical protein